MSEVGPETALSLEQAASLLGVHPRTVLRRLLSEANPSTSDWGARKCTVEQLGEAFRVQPERLVHFLTGRDLMMTLQEAADHLSLAKDTFWHRDYPAVIRSAGITRYSRHDVMNHHAEHWVGDPVVA